MPRRRRDDALRGRNEASSMTLKAELSQTESTIAQNPDAAEPAIAPSPSRKSVAAPAQAAPNRPGRIDRDALTLAATARNAAPIRTNASAPGRVDNACAGS